MTQTPAALSVVMSVRNGGHHLIEALRGIVAQTWTDFELIVVDDGSTDNTPEILAAAAASDHRITIITQQPRGLTLSLNRAIEASTAEFVARHDADDVSLPERFERQLAYFRAHPDVVAVGTAAVTIDEEGREMGMMAPRVGSDAVRIGLLTLAATPVHGSMMLRRAPLAEVFGYRPAFRAAQDFDLWLRLSDRHPIDNLPEALYQWRLHGTSVYATRREAQLKYAGVAVTFAHERRTTGGDSYTLLEKCGDDLDAFARDYRLRGRLEAWWGELLFRGLDDPRIARRHLGLALREGHIQLRTLGLYGWSLLGLRWPGGRTLQATGRRS